MAQRIRISFSLSAELRKRIMDYCDKKSQSGINFTISDFCRAATLEYLEKYQNDVDDRQK